MERRTGTDTGSGCGAVDLAVGENAHVAAVAPGCKSRPDQDRSVQEAEVFFERMLDREILHDRMFDAAPNIYVAGNVFRRKLQAHLLSVNQRIKCAAIGYVELHAAESGNIDALVLQVDKRRDVALELRVLTRLEKQAGLDHEFSQRDNRMPAHGAVALVV